MASDTRRAIRRPRRTRLRGAVVVPLAALAAGLAATDPPSRTPPRAATLAGQVSDAAGPVSGAEIRLAAPMDGDAAAALPVRARTDSAGRFAIDGIAAGEWTLDVRHPGHAPHVQRVTLRDGDTTRVQVTLRRTVQRLDTVAVQGANATPARYGSLSRMNTFYERRARGRGQFFAREDLERRTNQRFHEFLATTRGAKVRKEADGSVRVTFARCMGPAKIDTRDGSVMAIASGENKSETPTAQLYLDGHRMSDDESRRIIGELSLADIEAVEVYAGPSELPIESMGTACAAIWVWTRFGPGPPSAPAREDSLRAGA